MNQKIIEALQWRYATKKYSKQKISDQDFETISSSFQLTPTAYGLQPLKIIWVETEAIREELKLVSYNQPQITEASHVLVICSHSILDDAYYQNHAELLVSTRGIPIENASKSVEYMQKNISALSEDTLKNWTAKQAYIAIGQLMHTCALLHIDATPMEGFQPDKVDALLDLASQNLQSVLILTLGYRSEEDPNASMKKVRKPMNELLEKR